MGRNKETCINNVMIALRCLGLIFEALRFFCVKVFAICDFTEKCVNKGALCVELYQDFAVHSLIIGLLIQLGKKTALDIDYR